MIIAPQAVPYTLIWGGNGARLTEDVTYGTGIAGHKAYLRDYMVVGGHAAKVECALLEDGNLIVYAGTEWDFGSGPAIDTPSVIIASLAHDMICHLTNKRLIPWSCRAQGDRMYREMLKQNGTCITRQWRHYIGVRLYSELVARWKDRL